MVQIIRRHPAHTLDDLRAEMDRMFGGSLHAPQEAAAGVRVDVELTETEAAFVVRAELPGVVPDGLEVTATADRLVLAGEKLDPLSEAQDGRRYNERRFGSFRRELGLPAEIDPGAVTAEHAHGVLTVTLPKSGAEQPRRIEIQHG